ncbi:MAG TPA: DUF433 domain-containing protein [Thermoanaerobaculia bacterium]|nr:DUF433 domain-containing protein [Thermoanaerobaculia bacterium]
MSKPDRIVIDDQVASGQPVIRRTRVPVSLVVGKLAGGMSFEELMEEYALERQDILAALSYTARLLQDDRVVAILVEQGRLSSGKAAKLAGKSRVEFLSSLGKSEVFTLESELRDLEAERISREAATE